MGPYPGNRFYQILKSLHRTFDVVMSPPPEKKEKQIRIFVGIILLLIKRSKNR